MHEATTAEKIQSKRLTLQEKARIKVKDEDAATMTDKKVDYIKHRFDMMPSLGPDPRLFQTIIERQGVSIKMLA